MPWIVFFFVLAGGVVSIAVLAPCSGLGLAVLLWGPGVAEKLISSPDRSHPAFWIAGFAMLVCALLIGIAVIAIMMPILHRAGARVDNFDHPALRLLRSYAIDIAEMFGVNPSAIAQRAGGSDDSTT